MRQFFLLDRVFVASQYQELLQYVEWLGKKSRELESIAFGDSTASRPQVRAGWRQARMQTLLRQSDNFTTTLYKQFPSSR